MFAQIFYLIKSTKVLQLNILKVIITQNLRMIIIATLHCSYCTNNVFITLMFQLVKVELIIIT